MRNPFWDFADFCGIFPICSGMVRGFSRFVLFLALGQFLRAPTRNSPERVRDTIWTFPEKSGTPPGLEPHRLSLSQKNVFGIAFAIISDWRANISTSDFQSEVGEVFGEIGGELPAKFGRRFSSFFCWGKSSEAFSTKSPPQISPSNFTTRFWVVAGPININLFGR